MSAPIDPANTSTSTTAAATSADGQTKHRALGATIDGDEPRIAAGADLADVDVATADNGSSSGGSGGKRKRAPGAAVSTASALPTIDSLIAEKNLLIAEKNSLIAEKNSLIAEKHSLIAEQNSLIDKRTVLEGEKQDLKVRVRAGVTEAQENSLTARIVAASNEIVAASNEIVAASNRITGLDARIRDITASVLSREPLMSREPLTMDAVNAWLDANPLLADEPATPSSALWWKLGEKSLNANAAKWAGHAGFNILIGVSGAGKTRSMYEVLSHRFGFYWTCSRLGNGGSSRLNSEIGNLPERLTDANKHLVDGLVHEHLIAYSILLLQWRRRFPNGSPLQWHVFQTTTAVVDLAMIAIFAFLKAHTNARDNVPAALDAAKTAVGGARLVLVVDEAQELTRRGEFKSQVKRGEKRTLLSPFARACYDATALHNVWLTGTSVSLRSAVEWAYGGGGKDAPGLVVYSQLVFGYVDHFREYLRDVVCASISDALADELFSRFAGRARPVAVLAEYLVENNVGEIANDDIFRERVLDIANVCERDLLARPEANVRKVSLVAAFLNHVERTKSQDYLHRFVEIAKGAFEGRNFVVDVDAEVMSEHGIGQMRVNDVVRGADGAVTVRTLTVSEPLVPKMLIAVALQLDPTGSKGMHPVVSVLHNMAATLQPSVCGFLLEVLVVPIVHTFFVNIFKAGIAVPPGILVHSGFLRGLGQQFDAFGPEHAAGPDAVHTFGLGQVKFRASMSNAEWTDALRTVDRAQLYSEKANNKPLSKKARTQRNTRLANKAELRRQVNERLDVLWPGGYCSYIFTVCEPPARVQHVQVVDGRKLFVFSPRLSPNLFDGVARGVDVWNVLASIKEQQ